MSEKISGAIARLANMPDGLGLAEVLKLIQPELGDVDATISADLHRAEIALPNDKRVIVKVTSARKRASSTPVFRFKPPTESWRYEVLYFGGLALGGKPVIYRRTPKDIGTMKTLTFSAS